MARILAALLAAALLGAPVLAQQGAEPIHPPPHTQPWPTLGVGQTDNQIRSSLMIGPEMQRGRSAREMLAERRKLDAALAALRSQRRESTRPASRASRLNTGSLSSAMATT